MAYSSLRSIEGGRSVRRTTRQVKRKPTPTVSTVSSQTGARSYKPTRKSYTTSYSAPTTTAARSVRRAPAKKVRKAPSGPSRSQQISRIRKQLRQSAKQSRTGIASKLNRGFSPGEKITPRETALVAESEGLPGLTYSLAIAPGESGHQPGIRNPDDNTPSLFQITPSVQSAETQAKFDRIASKHKGGYSNPIVAAKQARVLAKDSPDEGVSNYVAFNPSAPQGHLPGGQKAARRKLYGKPEPIPKPLKEKAKRALGKQETREIIRKARKPSMTAAPKKLPGAWMGSKRAVLSKIPKDVRAEGKHDKRTPAENDLLPGASSTSDHLTSRKEAYAADLPYEQSTLDGITKELGVPKMTLGEDLDEFVKDGYRYQILTSPHGTGLHIHFGATWTGAEASTPVSTSAPSPLGAVSGGVAATGARSATRAASDRTRTARRRKPKNAQQEAERQRLLKGILAQPAPEITTPITVAPKPPTRRKVSLGLK